MRSKLGGIVSRSVGTVDSSNDEVNEDGADVDAKEGCDDGPIVVE